MKLPSPRCAKASDDPEVAASRRRMDCRLAVLCCGLAERCGWDAFTCEGCDAHAAPTEVEAAADAEALVELAGAILADGSLKPPHPRAQERERGAYPSDSEMRRAWSPIPRSYFPRSPRDRRLDAVRALVQLRRKRVA